MLALCRFAPHPVIFRPQTSTASFRSPIECRVERVALTISREFSQYIACSPPVPNEQTNENRQPCSIKTEQAREKFSTNKPIMTQPLRSFHPIFALLTLTGISFLSSTDEKKELEEKNRKQRIIHEALSSGNITLLERLVERGLNLNDYDGLWMAAATYFENSKPSFHSVESFRFLNKHIPELVNERMTNKLTLLQWSVSMGKADLVEALLGETSASSSLPVFVSEDIQKIMKANHSREYSTQKRVGPGIRANIDPNVFDLSARTNDSYTQVNLVYFAFSFELEACLEVWSVRNAPHYNEFQELTNLREAEKVRLLIQSDYEKNTWTR